MTKEEFIKVAVHTLDEYLGEPEVFDSNPMLRVNPESLDIEPVNGKDALKDMAFAEEAIEEAAAMQGDAAEDAADFQASRNPDFYKISDYLRTGKDGKKEIDMKAVDKLAHIYCE